MNSYNQLHSNSSRICIKDLMISEKTSAHWAKLKMRKNSNVEKGDTGEVTSTARLGELK